MTAASDWAWASGSAWAPDSAFGDGDADVAPVEAAEAAEAADRRNADAAVRHRAAADRSRAQAGEAYLALEQERDIPLSRSPRRAPQARRSAEQHPPFSTASWATPLASARGSDSSGMAPQRPAPRAPSSHARPRATHAQSSTSPFCVATSSSSSCGSRTPFKRQTLGALNGPQ